MTDVGKPRVAAPWLALLALVGFWFAVVRVLSPQWSVYVQYNYGWAVPFLCVYLLWQRWPGRPEVSPRRVTRARVVLGLCALLLLPTRILVEASPIWRAASWAIGAELIGLTFCVLYLTGGRAWLKHFWFPIAFFLIAVPWPSQWEAAVVQGLMRINTACVVEILTLLGIPALQIGNVIEISTGKVGIDEACSGIRSLQATLMIALFFGELYLLTARRRVGLLLSGVALAFLCNMARTFVLVRVCISSGIGALDKWHDPTGISILLVCFTGLWVIALKLRPAGVSVSESPAPGERHWFQPLPRFVSVGLVIWLAVIEGGTAIWFRWGQTANPGLINWSVQWPVEKPNLREVDISQRTRLEMKFKEGKSMSWNETDGSRWQVFYFSWGPANSLPERVLVQCAKAHRPEICLPASGLELRQNLGVKDFDMGALSLPFRAYHFEDRKLPLFVYFCATEDGTRGLLSNMRENTASRLAAARTGSRCVSQRVLEIAVWGYRDSRDADAAVLRQLQQLVQH